MIRLVFTSQGDPFQLLIRAGGLSSASHAAIGLGPNGELLLHAYEDGVLLETREYWLGTLKQKLVAEYEILPDVEDGLRQALAQVGKRYDIFGAIKIGVLRALDVFGSPVRSLGPDSKNAYTCAHFVMLLDPYGRRIPEWRLLNRATVIPGDLMRVAHGPSFRRLR